MISGNETEVFTTSENDNIANCFAYEVIDNAMYSLMQKGDIVLCRKHETIENGGLYAVLVGETVLLKRGFELDDIDKVRILGKAERLYRDI